MVSSTPFKMFAISFALMRGRELKFPHKDVPDPLHRSPSCEGGS